jgi:hypothetical protein
MLESMNLRLVLALVPLAAAACVTVRPVLAPATFIPARSPDVVWVTAQSGEIIPVGDPTLQGDTLVGRWVGTSEPVRFPLPQARVIQAAQPHRGRTALLAASIGVLAGFIVYRATQSSGPKANCHFDGHDWTCL